MNKKKRITQIVIKDWQTYDKTLVRVYRHTLWSALNHPDEAMSEYWLNQKQKDRLTKAMVSMKGHLILINLEIGKTHLVINFSIGW